MPKITIDLPADANEKLKKKAKEDYRSLTNYITVALINLANDTLPGMSSTPASAPYTLPNDTGAGIPVAPYKITCEQSTPSLTLDQLQQQGITQVKFNKPQQEVSPIEEQIQLNKLKEQRYKWIEKTIDRLYPEYKDFSNYDTFLSANQEMYWDKPDEEFIKHIEEVKREDEEYADEESPSDEDSLKATPHSPEYIKIKNYFTNHCAPYDFEDVTNHARLAKEGNENSIEYIKDYYDITLHDALGSPHSYDFSNDQWTELFKILSE